MSKKAINCSKKKSYRKSANFYKEKEYEKIFAEKYPHFYEEHFERYKYHTECRDYLNTFKLYFPPWFLNRAEYLFLKKAVKVLTPLAKPHQLADYLKIDIDYIYDALEDKTIPHFSHGSSYLIKTAEIIPFVTFCETSLRKSKKFHGKH